MKRPQITQIYTDSDVRKKICAHLCNLWIVLLLILSGCKEKDSKVYPQDRMTVEYSVDRETIQVGDPVELIVTAYYPTNGILELPEIGREKAVVLLGRDSETTPREDGLLQAQTRYALTSFRLGDQPVCNDLIRCTVNGQIFSTNFPPVTLHVESSLSSEDSSELADIKAPQKLPGRIPGWIWIVLGAAAVSFAIGIIISALWKNREKLVPTAPPVPAHVIALRALEALQQRKLLEQNECKPFYTELSLILRTYLEGRFNLNAPDETTEEIVIEMSRSPELSGTQRNILQEFMRQADMVKFAKGNPDRTTMESAFETTREFVNETKLTDTQIINHEDTKNTKITASSPSCLRGEKQI